MKPNAPTTVWDRVDSSGGLFACWPYTGARTHNGYGRHPLRNTTVRAHRLAWELTNGPIPAGFVVCHRCDNPPCCNPVHLFVGTLGENLADARQKGHLIVGGAHPRARLTEEQVRSIRTSSAPFTHLARRYGVSNTQIARVVRGQSWAHVR